MSSQHDPTSQIGGPSYCKNGPKVIFSQYEPLNQCEITPEMLDDHTVHKLVLIKIKIHLPGRGHCHYIRVTGSKDKTKAKVNHFNLILQTSN